MGTSDEDRVQGESDAGLLSLSRDGDRTAFSELWRRHAPAAVAYARSLGDAPPDPEDVVSEAFLRILHLVRSGGGPEERFRPYLLTTVRNMRMNALQRSPVAVALGEAEPHSSSIGAVDVEAMVNSEAIAEAFRSLPERWQQALWLSEVEQLPPRTIAEVLGLRPNSVSALTYRARAALRKAWIGAQLRRAPHGTEHARVVGLLGAYAQDELSLRSHRFVTAHLSACAPCRAAATEARYLSRTLALAPFLAGGAALVVSPLLLPAEVAAATVSASAVAASGTATGFGVHSGIGVAAGLAPVLWPVAAAAVIALTVGGSLAVQPSPDTTALGAPAPAPSAVVTLPPAELTTTPAPVVPLTPGIVEPTTPPVLAPSAPAPEPISTEPPAEPAPDPAEVVEVTPPVQPFQTEMTPVEQATSDWQVEAWVVAADPETPTMTISVVISGAAHSDAFLTVSDERIARFVRLDADGRWSAEFDVTSRTEPITVSIRYRHAEGDIRTASTVIATDMG